MDQEENGVVVDQEAEANPTGLRDQDQRVEQEGMISTPNEKTIIKLLCFQFF